MRRFTSRPTSQSHRPSLRLDITLASITQEDSILALTERHQIKFTLTRCHYPGQLNQNGQESTYKLRSTVQISGVTSVPKIKCRGLACIKNVLKGSVFVVASCLSRVLRTPTQNSLAYFSSPIGLG